MDWLGIDLGDIDLRELVRQAIDFALPRLLQSVALLVIGVIVYVVSRWGLLRVERHLTQRTRSKVDDLIVRLVRRVAGLSVVFWVLWRLAYIWELPRAAWVVGAIWLVGLSIPLSEFLADMLRIVEERVVPRTETTLDDTALPLLNKILRFLVVGLAVAMALAHLGIDITPLVAGASVVGVAVSFAAKDTLSNLVAGLLLILDRPFKVGDRIELWNAPPESGSWGDVVEIGLRATKIRNVDNLIIVIPNNEIMRRDIINYTASGDDIRVRIPIDIAYDADSHKAKRILLELAAENEDVLQEPPPQVIIREFGESGVRMQLRVWIANARQRRAVADAITDRVKEEFDRQGIEIPYPKRDLYIRTAPGDPPLRLPASAAAERDAAPLAAGDESADAAPPAAGDERADTALRAARDERADAASPARNAGDGGGDPTRRRGDDP